MSEDFSPHASPVAMLPPTGAQPPWDGPAPAESQVSRFAPAAVRAHNAQQTNLRCPV